MISEFYNNDDVLLQEEQHHLKQQLAELAIQINMDTLKARQIEVDDRKQQQMMKEKELEVCHCCNSMPIGYQYPLVSMG